MAIATVPDLDREIELLLRVLDEAFDRKAWHGTTLRGSLRGLGVAEALWRPAEGRHNIWELTLHAGYWKYAVRRRLTGEKRGSFPRRPSNFPAIPDPADSHAWSGDIALLEAEHARLREVVAAFPSKRLRERSGDSDHDFARLIYGAAAHDVYHTGQIQLLKRLQEVEGAGDDGSA